MPLMRCSTDGKRGWKWGKRGKCYTGTNARTQALRQGRAIEVNRGEKYEPVNQRRV